MNIRAEVNVLLVEDSPTDVLLARDVVEKYPEFRMRHVERLADAIKVLVEGGVDVVLLDLGLPDSQGLDTLVKLLIAMPEVPVVIMTARDDEDLALEAVHAGAQDYLVKNRVVNGTLRRTIRYAIERRQVERLRLERAALASLSADIGRALIRGGALREMLQQCTEFLVSNLSGAFARIWTLQEKTNVLKLQASAGMYTALDGRFGSVAVGEYHIGQIAADGRPHFTNDVVHDPRITDPEWARREGLTAFLGFPLTLEDKVVGVLGMFARKPFSDVVFEAMAPLANQIALGIGRKAEEEALKGSEARFRELTAHIGQVLWMLDARENKVLYVSPGYETMWGRSCQTLIDNPQSYMEGIHPLDLEMMLSVNQVMFQTGYIDAECRILRPDGTLRWVWIRGYPVLEGDQVARVVGVIEDITEKRRLASERDALLSRLQLHIARMPLAYVLFDAELRLVDWNSTAERIFGYTKDEMLGAVPPYEKLIPLSFRDEAETIFRRIRSGDMEAHSVNENLTKSGRTIICEWFNTPLMDEAGGFKGTLCLVQDVTERKTLEAQFHQAQKMEAVGQLAGGVAHDFNNLLTIILGYSEILLDMLKLDDPQRGPLLAISDAGERAAALTRQLLAFSRKSVLEPKVLDLNEVVRETEKLLRRLIGEDVLLTAVLDPKLSKVQIDPGQLGQVLMNLAVNARDAMPKGGRLTIETRCVEVDQEYSSVRPEIQPGRYVMLSMTDTGCGMTNEVKAKIFEPFFTTKEIGKGTGLGLSVVIGIIKQSGGHVAVYSESGFGTTFKLYIPAVPETLSVSNSPDLRTGGCGTETVLIVEDDNNVRGLAVTILRSKGYHVLASNGGKETLELVRQHHGEINLLMTDVVMPRMGGPELAEELRPLFPQMKVLFTSGYTDDAVVRHGLLKEQVAFLQKPYSPLSLARKVRQVLDDV
ncbi:MAG: Blue-light-activated protein [Planctomycetaceae bacterium]|nr:Blue-light-activated protein [Planctomycetaceae bacterium]